MLGEADQITKSARRRLSFWFESLREIGGTMLPFDNRPWAKRVAQIVIGVSVVAAIVSAYYLYDMDELHISEVFIILLLLLTIIPPNLAVIMKKHPNDVSPGVPAGAMNNHLRIR